MPATDRHPIPFTGADRHNDRLVISGKPKGGTSRFETYATMQVVTEEQLPTIAAVRLTEDVSKIEFVRKLLSESRKTGLKKPIILMDRGFSNVDVMRFLNEHGKRFLMAVSKTPGIKKAVSEFRCGKRDAVSRYEMRSGDGAAFRFWPVIKKRLKEEKGKRGWEYLTYATNVERRYKTHREGRSRGIQKALARREQLQVSRADARPHMQLKPCDQSLYALSPHDRVQPVVCGGAKSEQGNKDQVGAACQKKYDS